MKISELKSSLQLEELVVIDNEREVEGAYTGDLLSWVMTRLTANYAWITIMSNINAIAVAALSDAACIIFTENAEVSDAIISKAKEEGINLFRTEKSSFDISSLLGKMLYEQ